MRKSWASLSMFAALAWSMTVSGVESSLMTILAVPQKGSSFTIEGVNEPGLQALRPSASGGGQLAASFPVTAKVNNYSVALRASGDGRVRLNFFAARPRYGGASVAVSGIAINGKPVPNADYAKIGKNGFPVNFTSAAKVANRPEFVKASAEYPAAIRVAFGRGTAIVINVKANEVCRISADMRALEPFPDGVDSYVPLAGQAQSKRGGKAQTKSEFPVYKNIVMSKPAEVKTISVDDLKIDMERVKRLDTGSLYMPAGGLTRMAEFLMSPQGAELWNKRVESVTQTVNEWRFIGKKGFAAQRYIYKLGFFTALGLVYQLTGNPELGRFIKDHILQVAKLPIDFWCHAELRGCNPQKPVGGLENAHLSEAIAMTMSMVGDELFTAGERRLVDTELRTKGHQVELNWLERVKPDSRMSNWVAVIATGALITSKYFNDADGYRRASELIKCYLHNSIENDGSYGEGYSYFGYPVGTILAAMPALTPAEHKNLFAESPLRRTGDWLASGYFFVSNSDSKLKTMRAAFGDNGFYGLPNRSLALAAHRFYGDELMPWLCTNLSNADWIWENWSTLQLACAFNLMKIGPGKSPAELGLPTVQSFASGETSIRKNWGIDAPVLVLKRIGDFKTGMAHVRPESNSIAMAAYGEYFVVLPSSASYRSPIHENYDSSTVSANTVMVDAADQLLKGAAPAKMTLIKSTPAFDVAAQESAPRYAVPMLHAVRAVVLIKALDTFVLVDRYEAKKGNHQFDARLHFFNRDEAAKLTDNGDGHFLLTRPRADLAVFMASPEALAFRTAPGYMHLAGRDYSPGGPSEGKPGSAIELIGSVKAPTKNFTLFTVLSPVKKGGSAHPASFADGVLTVGGVKVRLNGGTLEVDGEKFKIF